MLAFTKNERIILILLILSLIAGSGLKLFKISKNKNEDSLILDKELKGFDKKLAAIVSTDTIIDSSKVSFLNNQRNNSLSIDLNSATKQELEKLPHIGPVIAQRIIDYRMQRGRFETIDELVNVKGIGNKTLFKIKPYLKCSNYNFKK